MPESTPQDSWGLFLNLYHNHLENVLLPICTAPCDATFNQYILHPALQLKNVSGKCSFPKEKVTSVLHFP